MFNFQFAKDSETVQSGLDRKNLPSKRVYSCSNHPTKEAFCMCAKCGAMLCNDCNFVVGNRRYCESCLVNDDNLRQTLERELFKDVQLQRATIVEYDGPQTWAEVPKSLLYMLKDSAIFFRGAYKTPLKISLPLAFLALLPNSIVIFVFKYDAILSQLSQSKEVDSAWVKSVTEAMESASLGTMIAAAVLTTFIKLFLLDTCLYASTKFFTRTKMAWRQICALLHFSLISYGLLIAIGTWFESQFIQYVALALMIINTSTGVRSATRCTLFQGLGAMLTFIILATLTRALYI